jgi:potassium efflux system protein
MLRYAVIALAVVLGLGALGLDTASLGWFFGAAGIGIGLGLQDVIGNFFSGLIMLVERPIRVGDVVQVGEATGTVESIRMRGTTLRTFDNTTVLIPNRHLLAERVTNLTYGMGHTRVLVQVGVSYDTNPQRVREILLGVARLHDHVLGDPSPEVWLHGFGESALEFTLVAYTDQVRSRFAVASALRIALLNRLRAEGIEIPFPQREVRVRHEGEGPAPG